MRGYVLGMLPARERTSVTDSELNQMKQIFHEAMEAGAFGFSAEQKHREDRPEDGTFIYPATWLRREEFTCSWLRCSVRVQCTGHIGMDLGFGFSPKDAVTMSSRATARHDLRR